MNTGGTFLGNFHPVFVHLPIGILLLALVAEWLSRREKYAGLTAALPLMFGAGAVTAVISCITGYLLSQSGEYDEQVLDRHKWLGIATALVSSLAYAFCRHADAAKLNAKLFGVFSLVLFGLITLTGHLGGSLTHGSDYLLANSPEGLKSLFGYETAIKERKPIPDVQEAKAYEDLVAAVFQEKCVGCHGPNKQKGKLRLDNPEMILRGGKNGEVLTAGNPDASELFKRIMLPLNDDDHMPPKEKGQLSKEDIALLHWWIKEGNDIAKKVKDIKQNDSIKRILASYQSGAVATPKTVLAIPEEKVAAGDPFLIDSMRLMGITVIPVAEGSNYLSVSFLNAKVEPDTVLKRLLLLKEQVIFLKLSGSKVSDEGAKYIAGLHHLTRLYLDNTKITDAGLVNLGDLKRLQYLNLAGTVVTVKGVTALKGLSELQTVYLFLTGIKNTDWGILKNQFPGVLLDSGGYRLEKLKSDTEVVKKGK
jgi:uncharacterized membrane protein